jgi:hypothetical protein
MKSGRPGSDWWRRRQPVIPTVRIIEISFSSVALLPRERIAAIIFERFFFEKTSDI